jgi:hypothetical protein
MSAERLQSVLENVGEADLDKLKVALANMKPEDLSKVKSVVAASGDTSKDKDSAAAAQKRSEVDTKYIQQTGLMDNLDGCFRCAVKMKPLDINKFAADYFSGELEKQKRLVLISSDAPEPEALKAAVRPTGDMGAPIVTAVYDFSGDPESFVKQIKDLVAEHGAFKTMALCCHGKDETKPEGENFKWKILGKCGVHIGKDGSSDPGAEDMLRAIADAVTVRIDLLACSLVGTPAGKDWMEAWEKKIGKNVAASTNITGNAEKGGDWVLESDGIDVSQVYFKKDEIAAYGGTFSLGNQISEWLDDHGL